MIDYLKIKFECIDISYHYIDSDIVSGNFIDYETSFEPLFVYDYPRRERLEKIVWCFTLVIRFARCGMLLKPNGKLYEETIKNINYMKSLSQNESNFFPKELSNDLEEVENYLIWLKEVI